MTRTDPPTPVWLAYRRPVPGETGREARTRRKANRNIPTWHGLDTHGGEDISFIDNTITACRRGIFLTDNPPRVTCTGNTLTCPTPAERSQTPPGGAPAAYLTDVRGISIVGGSGEITGNTGIGYPAGRWWNPISAGSYVTTGNAPAIP